MLDHGTGQAPLFYTLCREVDHTRVQCALLCLNPPTARAPITSGPNTRRRSDNICMSWNRVSCIFPGNCTDRHVLPASLHTKLGTAKGPQTIRLISRRLVPHINWLHSMQYPAPAHSHSFLAVIWATTTHKTLAVNPRHRTLFLSVINSIQALLFVC